MQYFWGKAFIENYICLLHTILGNIENQIHYDRDEALRRCIKNKKVEETGIDPMLAAIKKGKS